MTPKTAKFFAAALTTVGGLMMWLCGLCGAFFFVTGIGSAIAGHDSEDWGPIIAQMAVILGGLPALLGFGLTFLGRKWSARLDSVAGEGEAP